MSLNTETNFADDQFTDDQYVDAGRAYRTDRRTPQLDHELIVIHEGLIWAAAAILGAGCFSLGYMAGVWGWV